MFWRPFLLLAQVSLPLGTPLVLWRTPAVDSNMAPRLALPLTIDFRLLSMPPTPRGP